MLKWCELAHTILGIVNRLILTTGSPGLVLLLSKYSVVTDDLY